MPPKQGYGKKGNEQAGIKGTDTLVFVVDAIARYPKNGAPRQKDPGHRIAGRPADREGRRRLRSPPSPSRATRRRRKHPKVTVLAKGTGPAVSKGKLAVVEYTAVNFTGKAVGSSWQQGPQGVPNQRPSGPARWT